ncbi:MAG: tyrosine-type recombinase/integrase, partial [Silvibacterium sp.]
MRESLKLRDWQRAQEMIRQWEAEDRRTRHQEQQITIKDAHAKFIADAEARKLNESTLYKYRLLFRQLDAFAEMYKLQFLAQLDLDTLATFRSAWTEGPRTSLKKLERLRAFMRFAEKRKWIGDNPAAELKAPKVPNKPTMPFTREEMIRIFAALEPYGKSAGARNARRLWAFVLLLRYSGLRIGDATALEVSRLSENKLLLHTQKTGVPVYCVLPDAVVQALDAAPRSSERYFFWTGASTVRSTKGKWQRRLQRLFEFAKVPTGHPHRFRDTFAVELLLAGVPLDRVSILLGHSSIRITERHYAPWTRSRQEQIEADLRAAWNNDPLIKEVHAGYAAKPAVRTRVFSRRRIGRGGGDRTKRDTENSQVVGPIEREKREKQRICPSQV